MFTTISITGTIVSIPFLILTYFHYYYSTEFQYLYRKLFLNYVVSLMLVYICFLLQLLYYVYYDTISYFIHFLIVFGLMLKLLWTNVLCFNFWWSAKNLMPYDSQRTDKNTYIQCCMYVWLATSIHFVFIVVIEYTLSPIEYNDWKIDLLRRIFITFPPAFVLIINCLMMTHVIIIMVSEVRNLTQQNVIKIKEDKKKLILCFKLLAVTIFDLLLSTHFWSAYSYFFSISQIIMWVEIMTSFQGLFIFIMFTLQKKNIFVFKKWVFEIFSRKNIVEE